MGVEYTWLATDQTARVYVLWTDKLGARPDTPCLEEDALEGIDAFRDVLDLEDEGSAVYYAHPNHGDPATYQRSGGPGALRASDLPEEWARAARSIRLPIDEPPAELLITDYIEVVSDEGMTEAETAAYIAGRSLSWRIRLADEAAEPDVAYRAHLEQVVSTLVFDAMQRASQAGLTLELGPVLALLADTGVDLHASLARFETMPLGEASPLEMAMHEGRIAVVALNKTFLERGGETRELLHALNEHLCAQVPHPTGASPFWRADCHLVETIALPEPEEFIWLAVDENDRVFVFRCGDAGARPATFACLQGHASADTVVLREVLGLDDDPFLGPADYYDHQKDSEPGEYILDGGRGRLQAETLPHLWNTMARRLCLSLPLPKRQPGRITVNEHLDLDAFKTL